jgi:hypothetical protein
MKIHTTDGSIEFAHGAIGSKTTRASFLASPLGRRATLVVENAPFATYRFAPEPGVGATLLFDGERLKNFAWAVSMPNEDVSSWTQESELQRKKLHEKWLAKELGVPPYQFDWGEVVSEFDAKGVSSAIIVAYDQ